MSADKKAMDVALLEIAKDLLQASDDLAATDPTASAKLAYEAFEIGRDLSIVREYLEEPAGARPAVGRGAPARSDAEPAAAALKRDSTPQLPRQEIEDDSDDELFRILDRQKAIVPDPADFMPVRKAGKKAAGMMLEPSPRRSGWFGWMHPKEWRHAG